MVLYLRITHDRESRNILEAHLLKNKKKYYKQDENEQTIETYQEFSNVRSKLLATRT